MLFYTPLTIHERRLRGVEQHAWRGHIRLAIQPVQRMGGIDVPVGLARIVRFDNAIMSVGKDYLAGMLAGLNTTGITYVALGNSSAAVTTAQTQLGSETFRKQITKQTQTVGTNNLDTTTYIASFEANAQIQEIGWFAGPTATGTANTGIMIARVLYSHLKAATESIQIDRVDQF